MTLSLKRDYTSLSNCPLDIFFDVYRNENHDFWENISYDFKNLEPIYESISQENIIGVYVIILNEKREILLNLPINLDDWCLPGGLIIDDDFSHTILDTDQTLGFNMIQNHNNIKVKMESLFAIKNYSKKSGCVKINRYATYYLAKIVDEEDSTQSQYSRWSKLIELPIYKRDKVIFDNLYNPWKIQLILDLDATLFESAIMSNTSNDGYITDMDLLFKHHYLPNRIGHIMNYTSCVWTRPFMYQFLNTVVDLTDLSYWTAGSQNYQDGVLSMLKIGHLTQKKFYLHNCQKDANNYPSKSIEKLNEKLQGDSLYDMNRALLIDDLPLNHTNNPKNSYLISGWHVTNLKNSTDIEKNYKDMELMSLLQKLIYLSDLVIHEKITMSECLDMINKPL